MHRTGERQARQGQEGECEEHPKRDRGRVGENAVPVHGRSDFSGEPFEITPSSSPDHLLREADDGPVGAGGICHVDRLSARAVLRKAPELRSGAGGASYNRGRTPTELSWQSSWFVNSGSPVRIPPSAPNSENE